MENRPSSSQKLKGYPVISKGDLKCVWMTAGLLTYKLCKYNLECERCPLDRELRNLSAIPSSPDSPLAPDRDHLSLESPGEKSTLASASELFSYIKPSLFYHPGHTWVKVESEREVQVGIDPFLAELMGEVKAVLFTLSNRRCHQGETLCSIIQDEGILHICSPISGSLLSLNPKLRTHPDLIRQSPLEKGYLLTLRPKNLRQEQRHFLYGEEALSWCRKEWERFKMEVLSEGHPGHEQLGRTLQDGPISMREMKRGMAPERYSLLINTFLRKGERLAPER